MGVLRAQFVYSGGAITYTLPINPIEYNDPDTVAQNVMTGIDGNTALILHSYDSRPRTMTWHSLPNNTTFGAMITTLKTLIGRTDVVLKKRDLNRTEVPIGEDETPIKVLNVATEYGKNRAGAIHNLGFANVVLTYKHRRTV